MPLTVQRDGAAPAIVSIGVVFDWLLEDADFADLLGRVLDGELVSVTLRDGTTAVLSSIRRQALLAGPAQPALALAMPVDRAFELECKVLLPVDALVQVTASTRQDAEARVLAIFGGRQPTVQDRFHILIDRGELDDTFRHLDDLLINGNPADWGAHQVLINRIEER